MPDRPRFIPKSLFENIGIIYYLIPYVDVIDNTFSLLFSILIGIKNYKIKIKGYEVNFKASQFMTMMDLFTIKGIIH